MDYELVYEYGGFRYDIEIIGEAIIAIPIPPYLPGIYNETNRFAAVEHWIQDGYPGLRRCHRCRPHCADPIVCPLLP